jgi:5'-3' exonuclease
MQVHLIDGTFELFRAFYGAPPATVDGRQVGAVRGLIRSVAALLRAGEVTHAGVAFDHVIESFRNQLFPGYKTGEGIEPALLSQFELAERAVAALGLSVWPMVEFEADDALATAAAKLDACAGVDAVVLATPDKDLAQCVRGVRVTMWDRVRGTRLDESGVIAKFGVPPTSIPDLLALVGDDADGIPGLPRWGARSAAAVLGRWGHIEDIPDDHALWEVEVRGAASLAAMLRERRGDALLYKELATLRVDVPIACSPVELAWRGADAATLEAVAAELGLAPQSLGLRMAAGSER